MANVTSRNIRNFRAKIFLDKVDFLIHQLFRKMDSRISRTNNYFNKPII